MNDALTAVLLRRERILARIAQQRDGIELSFAGLAGPIALIDRIVAAGRVLRDHPAAVAILVAAIVVLRARTMVGMVTRGIGVWRLIQHARALLVRLGF